MHYRITQTDSNGVVCWLPDLEAVIFDKDCSNALIGPAIDLLAAYEDTGLTPEEIKELKHNRQVVLERPKHLAKLPTKVRELQEINYELSVTNAEQGDKIFELEEKLEAVTLEMVELSRKLGEEYDVNKQLREIQQKEEALRIKEAKIAKEVKRIKDYRTLEDSYREVLAAQELLKTKSEELTVKVGGLKSDNRKLRKLIKGKEEAEKSFLSALSELEQKLKEKEVIINTEKSKNVDLLAKISRLEARIVKLDTAKNSSVVSQRKSSNLTDSEKQKALLDGALKKIIALKDENAILSEESKKLQDVLRVLQQDVEHLRTELHKTEESPERIPAVKLLLQSLQIKNLELKEDIRRLKAGEPEIIKLNWDWGEKQKSLL